MDFVCTFVGYPWVLRDVQTHNLSSQQGLSSGFSADFHRKLLESYWPEIIFNHIMMQKYVEVKVIELIKLIYHCSLLSAYICLAILLDVMTVITHKWNLQEISPHVQRVEILMQPNCRLPTHDILCLEANELSGKNLNYFFLLWQRE